MKTIQERLEEFREKKDDLIDIHLGTTTSKIYCDTEELEKWIETALTEQLDELEKEVDKLRYTGNPELKTNQDFGVNKAISQVKQLIANMKN